MAKKSNKEGTLFLRYFGPLLDALRALGGSGTPAEVAERIAKDLNLSDDIQNEVLPSGGSRYQTNVAWARFYLAREGLLDSSKRGVWSLTEQGRKTTLNYDKAQELFKKWVRVDDAKRQKEKEQAPVETHTATAEDTSATAGDYRAESIELLLALPPAGFERLCQRLLREAGFIQVVVTGSSGDGGIDGYGTLQVNPLVSFKVLFQCKRYSKSVSSSHVRDFRGAMAGRADKGIIITTGTFTAEARREASRDGVPPIELVDGDKLIDMFENLEFGLKPVTTYELDKAFFDAFKA
jgi:restriction system protein